MIQLSDIFDQNGAIDWITSAWQADRLPHGMIFAGPAGVGKSTTARALAGLFLCERPSGVSACGACDSCRVFAAGNHPDFSVVYRQLIRLEKEESKAKDLSIDVIRDYLIAKANLKPVMNKGRVFVVEEAETMNAAAQNSLLKTLEEPFGRTLIILITDQPNALLQTIRSRTQLLRFQALSSAVVISQLIKRGFDAPTAQNAAKFADGSLGLAIKWLEDGVIALASDLEKSLDRLLAGESAGDLAEWYRQAADAYSKKQVERDENVSLDQSKREGLSVYFRLTAQRFQRFLRETQDASHLDHAATAIEAIAHADDYLDANVNIPIILQQLSLTLKREWVA